MDMNYVLFKLLSTYVSHLWLNIIMIEDIWHVSVAACYITEYQ